MKIYFSCLLAALPAVCASAQSSGDAAFRQTISMRVSAIAARQSAAVSTPAAKSAAPASCEPAKELETSFSLTVPQAAAPIKLTYAGCSEEGRNDYLSGYTERAYNGTGGYGLTLVTNHGDGAHASSDEDQSTEILVSKGNDWVARLGTVANAAIASGKAVSADGYVLRADKTASAGTLACQAALPKTVYQPNQLWLLTPTKAYYFRQDCDICAELDSCDLATHAVKAEIVAHSVSCSDLDRYRQGANVLYDACAK